MRRSTNYPARVVATLQALDPDAIGAVVAEVQRCFAAGGTLFVCGNGGSYATALHLAADLGKSRPVIALGSNGANLTRIANDYAYADVYAQELASWARHGDTLLCISASGNSENVLRALRSARLRKVAPLGLLGMGGGAALDFCRAAVVVGSNEYGVVEDCHSVLCHTLVEACR